MTSPSPPASPPLLPPRVREEVRPETPPHDELFPYLDLDAGSDIHHPEDFVNEGLYDNSDTESSIDRMVDDNLSLREADLDRDLLLGEDIYETIHYYSRNVNRELDNISPVVFESYSGSSSGSEESINRSAECEVVKFYDRSDSSRSDVGYSSNLNTTNNDESLMEFDVKKKESFCSYQPRNITKEDPMGRSVSDSFLDRVKGFRFLKGKKTKKTKSLSKTNNFETSASSHKELGDSGVMNYGSTEGVHLPDFDDSLRENQFESLNRKFGKNKKHDGFNPCCVG